MGMAPQSHTMLNNPLVMPILEILKRSRNLSEYDIIQQLQQQGIQFPGSNDSYEMAIFKKHFMTMNALYRLQLELYESGYLLTITSVKVCLQPLENHTQVTLPVDDGEQKLRDYYLDWRHFETTQEDIEHLLNNFWTGYFTTDQLAQSLESLQLDTGCSWQDIQLKYRQLVNQHHPDKGGDQTQFIVIRQAFEVLRQYYR